MMGFTYQFAVAQAAYPGFALDQAGDRYVVEPFDDGLLVAGIDGLGHGPKAATAGIAAADALREHASQPVTWLLEHCNRAIHGTRGAAVTVVSISSTQQQLEWAGVGNVSAVILRDETAEKKSESLLTRAGVVGFRMPRVHITRHDLCSYDTLILTTDGIRSGFLEGAPVRQSSQELADHILNSHKRDTDDALVIVVRLLSQ